MKKHLLMPVLCILCLTVGGIAGNLLPEWREMFNIYPDYGTVLPYDMTVIECHSDGTGIDYSTEYDAGLVSRLTSQAYEYKDDVVASIIVDGFGQVVSIIINGKAVSTTPAGYITPENLSVTTNATVLLSVQ